MRCRYRQSTPFNRERRDKKCHVISEWILGELGFTPETAALPELVPMVEMAWVEGGVQGRERKEIIEAAQRRGVEFDSAAYTRLTGWLEHRPSDDFFARSRRAVKGMLQQLPSAERDLRLQGLLARIYRVANASGGMGRHVLTRSSPPDVTAQML